MEEVLACVVCGARLTEARCGACGAAARPGGYEVRRLLARTPHSRVYLARDASGRDVALKELLFAQVPGARELDAFEREARLLQTLSHPRIPRLLGHFQEGEGAALRLYMASEYISGETLLERLSHHTFSEREAQDIARQVLELLVYLHGRTPQVLHRDLKPANLIRRPDGTLVLVDFGAAREAAQGATAGATLVGTFGYMPLEQFGGTVDATSDLYALGATLVHLLGRTPPAEHFQPDEGLKLEHLEAPTLRPWLRKLTALRASERYPSARAARQALDALKPSGQPVHSEQVATEAPSAAVPAVLAQLEQQARAARAATAEARGRSEKRVLDAAQTKALEARKRQARFEDDHLTPVDFYRMASHWATTPAGLPVVSLFAGAGVYFVATTFNLMELPDLESRQGLLLLVALVALAFLVVGGPLMLRAWRWRRAFRRLPFAVEGLGQVVHRADGEWERFTRCSLRLLFREMESPPGTDDVVKTARSTALRLMAERANESLSSMVTNPELFQKLHWTVQGDKAEGYANWRTCGRLLDVCSESLAPMQRELGLLQAVLLEPTQEQYKLPNKRGKR